MTGRRLRLSQHVGGQYSKSLWDLLGLMLRRRLTHDGPTDAVPRRDISGRGKEISLFQPFLQDVVHERVGDLRCRRALFALGLPKYDRTLPRR